MTKRQYKRTLPTEAEEDTQAHPAPPKARHTHKRPLIPRISSRTSLSFPLNMIAIVGILLVQLLGLGNFPSRARLRTKRLSPLQKLACLLTLLLISQPICDSFAIEKPLQTLDRFQNTRPFHDDSELQAVRRPYAPPVDTSDPEPVFRWTNTPSPPALGTTPTQVTTDSTETVPSSSEEPRWNRDPNFLQEIKAPNAAKDEVLRRDSGSAFEEQDIKRQGYTLKKASPTVHFVRQGKVSPARGYAHLVLRYNLNQTYSKANMLQSLASELFSNYLNRSSAQLPRPATPPLTLAVGAPPAPESYYVRPHEIIRPRSEGQLSVMELLDSWYFLSPEHRQAIAKAHRAWVNGGKQHSPWFNRYLTIGYPDLLSDATIYLDTHKGPWPHQPLQDIQQDHDNITGANHFALDLAHTLTRASEIRLQAAALYDLPAKIGQSSIYVENKFKVDEVPFQHGGLKEREWAEQGVTRPKASERSIRKTRSVTSSDPDDPAFDFSIAPNQSPNPRRSKRALFFFFALICTVLLVANTIMSSTSLSTGIYNKQELHKIKTASSARLSQIKDASTTIAKQVNQNAKVLNDHAEILVTMARDIDAVSTDVHYTRMQLLLTAQLDTMQTEINALTDLMDHLAIQRITASITASYNLRDDLAELEIVAGRYGNVLLIDQYTDILQCEASLLQERGELTATVHIPMGRKDEVLTLYRFIPYPFIQEGYHTMVAHDDSRLLAVNDDNTRYRSYTRDELQECTTLATSADHWICQSGTILSTFDPHETEETPKYFQFRETTNCLMSLRMQRGELIKQTCNLWVTRPVTDVTRINTNTFRIISEDRTSAGYVECADSFAHNPFGVKGSYDLMLSPGCTGFILGYILYGGDEVKVYDNITISANITWLQTALADIKDKDKLSRFIDSLDGPLTVNPLDLDEILDNFTDAVFSAIPFPGGHILSAFNTSMSMGALAAFFVALNLFLYKRQCCCYAPKTKKTDQLQPMRAGPAVNVNLGMPSPPPVQSPIFTRASQAASRAADAIQKSPLVQRAYAAVGRFTGNKTPTHSPSAPSASEMRLLNDFAGNNDSNIQFGHNGTNPTVRFANQGPDRVDSILGDDQQGLQTADFNQEPPPKPPRTHRHSMSSYSLTLGERRLLADARAAREARGDSSPQASQRSHI